MLVHQAYRFELDCSNHVGSSLASHAGAARFAYNWGLALVIERLAGRRAMVVVALRQGAGVSDANAWAKELVAVPWNLYALRKEWNAAKADVAPWWAANSKEAYSSGLDGLARALQDFSDSRSAKRNGPRVGFARFHKRGSRRSFRYSTGAFGVLDAHHVRLPRVGVVRTKEATTALAQRVETGTARVLSATVTESAGRWYVSFGCEVDRASREPSHAGAVGVDVGSSPWPCSPPARSSPTPSTRVATTGAWPGCKPSCHVATGQARADAPRGAGRPPRLAWGDATPRRPTPDPTPDPTACTSSPPAWPPATPAWWSKTSTWRP